MKKHFKPLALGMGLGLMLILLIAAAVPFAAFNANQFTSSTANNSVSIASGALTTNINLAGTVAGSPTLSGLWTFTNNPQTLKPLNFYATNAPFTGTINTTTVTAPSGTFTGWQMGDNIAFLNGEQYGVGYVVSSSTITITAPLQSTHTGDTTGFYYPGTIRTTDINGNYVAYGLDSGGNMYSGGSSPSLPFLYAPLAGAQRTALGGAGFYLGGASGLLGPVQIRIGGNYTYGPNQASAVEISTMAPFDSFIVLSNGLISFKYGLTNWSAGTLHIYGPVDFPQTLVLPNETASRVAILDSTNGLHSSTVTTTTLAFLDATSSIQTQLNGKLGTTIAAFKASFATTNLSAATNFDCLSAFVGYRSTTNTAIAFQLTNEWEGYSGEIDLENTGATATPNVTVTASTGNSCRAANQTPGATVSYATPAANRVLRVLIVYSHGTNKIDFVDNY